MPNDWQMSKDIPEVILKVIGSTVSISKRLRQPSFSINPSHPQHWALSEPVIKQIRVQECVNDGSARIGDSIIRSLARTGKVMAGRRQITTGGNRDQDQLEIEMPAEFTGNMNLSFGGDSHLEIGDLSGGSFTLSGSNRAELRAHDLHDLTSVIIHCWGECELDIDSLHVKSVVINMYEQSKLYIDDLKAEQATIVAEDNSRVIICGQAQSGTATAKGGIKGSKIKLHGDFGHVLAHQQGNGEVVVRVRTQST